MNINPAARSGYVLFEVVLALTIFAIAVVGLTQSLNISLEAAGRLNREHAIRTGLRSFIEETRRKEIADMATESRDERLGVTYSSTVDELTMKNQEGTVLSDLYALHAKASWGEDKDSQEETVDLYIYKPQITPAAAAKTSATTNAAAPSPTSSASNAPGGGAPSGGTGSGGGQTGGRSGR